MKLTLSDATAMRADRAAGMTVAECARKYGVSWNHAKRVIVGENHTGLPHANRRITDAAIAEIRKHLANDDKLEWIAMEVGCSYTTVSHIKNNRRRFAA